MHRKVAPSLHTRKKAMSTPSRVVGAVEKQRSERTSNQGVGCRESSLIDGALIVRRLKGVSALNVLPDVIGEEQELVPGSRNDGVASHVSKKILYNSSVSYWVAERLGVVRVQVEEPPSLGV